ncbi:hypothetical protein EK21DRAFT_86640 [Setomelanomma holmii]|uniref:Uncharacterized protein n=1 Tax=Setomelanomma holmii TaxID=210430 RepID=A0A9P4HDS1_9PLEO|nr:hypothetical protein EK21DRAFT_86640 [Setomelanomma holmii]
MTNVLNALFRDRDDHLRLRRYMCFTERIAVNRDGNAGVIPWKSPHPQEGYLGNQKFQSRFTTSNDGQDLSYEIDPSISRAYSFAPGKTFHKYGLFTSSSKEYIWNYVIRSEEVVGFDLNGNKCTAGQSPAAMQITKMGRRMFSHDYWNHNCFEVELASIDARTNFSSYEALRLWLCNKGPPRHPWDAGRI